MIFLVLAFCELAAYGSTLPKKTAGAQPTEQVAKKFMHTFDDDPAKTRDGQASGSRSNEESKLSSRSPFEAAKVCMNW
jgi:hypothetical protein